MTSLTGSAGLVALVQASTALPIMLFSLAAGAIADNYDKRAVMLVAQVFTIAVSVVLAGCTYFGLITPWSLLIFTFLIGCGTAVNNPAWQSSVRDMVPRQDLPQAIALSGVSMNIARSVGPALGWSHRCHCWSDGRFRRERLQLSCPDPRPLPLEAGAPGSAVTAGIPWELPWAPGSALWPCRRGSGWSWFAHSCLVSPAAPSRLSCLLWPATLSGVAQQHSACCLAHSA